MVPCEIRSSNDRSYVTTRPQPVSVPTKKRVTGCVTVRNVLKVGLPYTPSTNKRGTGERERKSLGISGTGFDEVATANVQVVNVIGLDPDIKRVVNPSRNNHSFQPPGPPSQSAMTLYGDSGLRPECANIGQCPKAQQAGQIDAKRRPKLCRNQEFFKAVMMWAWILPVTGPGRPDQLPLRLPPAQQYSPTRSGHLSSGAGMPPLWFACPVHVD